MTRKISLDDLRKIESSTFPSLAINPNEIVQAILKVTRPHYVPGAFQVRGTIDPCLLTGHFKRSDLGLLEKDPLVESVSINQKLQSSE